MKRERLSIILSLIGAGGTVGLLGSGILLHYGVVPGEGPLSILMIGLFGVMGIVGMALSVVLAIPMKRETALYALMVVIYSVSLLGFIVSFITAQSNGAPWWLVLLFGLFLVGSSLLLPIVDRWRKQQGHHH